MKTLAPFSLGLRGMATTIIVGVTVLALVVTTGVSVVETNQTIKKHYTASVTDAAHSLAVGCEQSLTAGDYGGLARLAHQFVQRDNGAFVVVFDGTGRIVSYAESEEGLWESYRGAGHQRAYAVAEKDIVALDSGDYVMDGSKPDDKAEVIGKVLVGDTTEHMYSSQHRQALRACLAALIMAVIAVPLALLLFQFWVRRLNRLLVASDRLASGDLSTPIDDDRNDEIGRLARGFDQMRLSIKKHNKKLKAFNETLKQSVEERTQALNHSVALTNGILHSAADAVITIDPEGKIGAFNPAAAKLFGVQAKDAAGLAFNAFLAGGVYVDPEGLVCQKDEQETQILGSTAEVEVINGKAERVPIQISLAVLTINGRKHLSAVIRDMTDRRKADAEREEMVGQLLEASRHAGMAEVATSVLHNVGNVLNSINVSVQCVQDQAQGKAADQLIQAASIIEEHREDFADFVANDPHGQHLPDFISQVSRVIAKEREGMAQELTALSSHVEHVKRIITTQQSYAKNVGVDEETPLRELIQDALRINAEGLRSYQVQVREKVEDMPPVSIDKHACLQILVNLVRNARNAMEASEDQRILTIQLKQHPGDDQRFVIQIQDSGYGIKPENLMRIFNHGFTTRKEGNGYGLHSAALAAQKMGGSLTVESEGEGKGACFILDLPKQPPSIEQIEEAEGDDLLNAA